MAPGLRVKPTYMNSVIPPNGSAPKLPKGWEAKPGTSEILEVEEGWGGRIWARTGCDFTTDLPSYEQCETGGCNGGLVCADVGGGGVIPASLAEFNTQPPTDHYDASNVDGSNLAFAITTPGFDCPLSNCPYDLNKSCPDSLKKLNKKGDVVGCLTDCGATAKDEYCCAGAHALPETCPSDAIPNYKWWKASCPMAYAFAYDEASGTALFTCDKHPDYVITFCPSKDLYSDTATLPDGRTVTQSGVPAETVALGGGGGGDASPTKTSPDASPTKTGDDATSSKGKETGASPTATGGATGAATGGRASSAGTSVKTSAAETGAGASKTSTPAGASSATSTSSSLLSGDTILGMDKNLAVGIAVAVVAILIVGVALALRSKKSGGHRLKTKSDTESDDSETDSSSDDDRR